MLSPCPLWRRYRRLHAADVTVPAEELRCSGELVEETQQLLAAQLAEERMAAARPGARPPPLFLANAGSRHKRCRGAPAGSDPLPRLHRVALLTPQDDSGTDWAASAVQQQRRRWWQRRLQQHDGGGAAAQQLHLRQAEASLQLPGAGGELQAAQQRHNVLGAGGSRGGAPADITAVTQLSIDRLPSLRQQCASWAGPTVAVIYAPLVGGRLVGFAGHEDAEVAALEGGTPLHALAHVRRFHASLRGMQGEWGGWQGRAARLVEGCYLRRLASPVQPCNSPLPVRTSPLPQAAAP